MDHRNILFDIHGIAYGTARIAGAKNHSFF
jgi:hypothetical protein